jgi:hypothetical protein
MDTEGVNRPLRQPAADSRRRAALAAALIAVALGLAACGGGFQQAPGSQTSPGGASSVASPTSSKADRTQAGMAQLLKFAECMRSHGVTGYADPSSSGLSAAPNPSSPAYQAGQKACKSLMPGNGK